MRLTVKRTRSSLKFDLELPSDPPPGVEDLQRLIFKKCDIPEWAQRVFHQGRYLRGSGSLSEQGVPAEGGVLLLATSAHLLEEPSQSLVAAATSVPAGSGGASSSTQAPQPKSMPKAPTRAVPQAAGSAGAAQAMTAFLQLLTTPTNGATATSSSQTTDLASAGHSVQRANGAHLAQMEAIPKPPPPTLGSPPVLRSMGVPMAKTPPMKAPPPHIHRLGPPLTGMLSAPAPPAMPQGVVRHPQVAQLPESLRSAMQQVAPQLLSQMQASGAGQQANHQLFAQMNMAVEQALGGHAAAQVISRPMQIHTMGPTVTVPAHSMPMLPGATGVLPVGLAPASYSTSSAGSLSALNLDVPRLHHLGGVAVGQGFPDGYPTQNIQGLQPMPPPSGGQGGSPPEVL